jgi:hypothetical protein
MPSIDLGGWPDKRDFMAMHRLWALMAFPEDTKKTKSIHNRRCIII